MALRFPFVEVVLDVRSCEVLACSMFDVAELYHQHVVCVSNSGNVRINRRCTENSPFISGRTNGERLFEGAELTMRWMARTLGMEWLEPLHLRGLEVSSALADSPELQASVSYYTAKVLAGLPR